MLNLCILLDLCQQLKPFGKISQICSNNLLPSFGLPAVLLAAGEFLGKYNTFLLGCANNCKNWLRAIERYWEYIDHKKKDKEVFSFTLFLVWETLLGNSHHYLRNVRYFLNSLASDAWDLSFGIRSHLMKFFLFGEENVDPDPSSSRQERTKMIVKQTIDDYWSVATSDLWQMFDPFGTSIQRKCRFFPLK